MNNRALVLGGVLSILVFGAHPSRGQALQDQDRIQKLERKVAELEEQLKAHEKLLEAMILKIYPERAGAFAHARVVSCANNLRQLWTMQTVYMSQFGGRMKKMPEDIGSAFWIALTKTQPPLIDGAELEVLVCPLTHEKPRAGFTTYRGPPAKVSSLAGDDVVGCCDAGDHPDGSINVLKKSGDVLTVKPGDALYKTALEKTLSSPEREKSRSESNERNASTSLKTLATAEADFRANDRDYNKLNDFWVGDISGLYRFLPADKQPIKLIYLGLAEADASPLTIPELGPLLVEKPKPMSGYLYTVLQRYSQGGDLLKYHKGTYRNTSQFGLATYPADYPKTGTKTFILSESNTIFWKDTNGKPPDSFPEDPAKDGWKRLD